MDNLTKLQHKTLEVLVNLKGKEITGRKLAKLIGIKKDKHGKVGANMRAIINALRTKGWPICANSEGYFYAQTPEQLSKYIVDFQARIDKQQQACDGLQNAFDKIENNSFKREYIVYKVNGKEVAKIPKHEDGVSIY